MIASEIAHRAIPRPARAVLLFCHDGTTRISVAEPAAARSGLRLPAPIAPGGSQ